MNRFQPLPLATAYAFSLFGALYGLPAQPAHELHLFLADHYARDPWSLADSRWPALDVGGHPPLLHLLVALLGKLPGCGVERAYALICVAAVLGVVGLAARAARAETSTGLAWLLGASPLLSWIVFARGETPLVLGWALATASLVAVEGINDARSRWVASIGTAGLAAAAAFCHPLAGIVASVWLWLDWLLRRGSPVGLGAAVAAACATVATTRNGLDDSIVSLQTGLASGAILLAVLVARRARLAMLHRPALSVASCVALIAVTAFSLGQRRAQTPDRRYERAVHDVAALFSDASAAGFRYAAVGLGNEQLELARRAPLSNAGVQLADIITVLNTPAGADLRWVVSAERFGDTHVAQVLEPAGYRVARAWSGGVVLWEKPTAIAAMARSASERAWAWSLAPLILLLAGLGAVAAAPVRLASRAR